jgi:acetyl-CoA acetyltransferase
MDVSLSIGVEKTFVQGDATATMEIFEGGIDQLDPEEWHNYYAKRGTEAGKPFDPNSARGTVFMDTYAMQAAWHMKAYGTTQEQIAIAASKNHWHGSMNPKAQYRFEVPVEEALKDREISYPITRAMAAPIGDGAAAAILVSEATLKRQPPEVRTRAIKIRGSVLSGGKYRDPTEPGLSRIAAQKAYAKSGLTAADIDMVELHDATSFCEIFQLEMLGFAEDGTGGKLVESGATKLGGRLPVNLSGGLVSKGHPVGATGLSMLHELGLQLRREAGDRQTDKARIAMAENGGGVIGFDEAACSVILLEAPAP